ncbi:response regulator [Virgibacillus sp. YIM 98842]|jgi:two-component system chemotaxis response regulator CheY|uniref:response regulator n=1 Tax=Virgibacillus sp. YIM 98842 TaxID=2663533 RepID=UPI0013DB3926|nr:response regulator [Virgibacillus sp. YIM 98842]
MAAILVVDDAKFLRITLRKLLEKDNHEVVGEAKNGKEAITLYKNLSPDLVIMDLTMPVMNGIDAMKAIMEIDSKANIIVCSAIGEQKVVVQAIEAGGKDFILKPFEESRILETVRRVLENFHLANMV